jgi:hypothetical protein
MCIYMCVHILKVYPDVYKLAYTHIYILVYTDIYMVAYIYIHIHTFYAPLFHPVDVLVH